MQERKAKSIVDIIDLIKDHEAAVWVILGDESVSEDFLTNVRIYYFDAADTLHISTEKDKHD